MVLSWCNLVAVSAILIGAVFHVIADEISWIGTLGFVALSLLFLTVPLRIGAYFLLTSPPPPDQGAALLNHRRPYAIFSAVTWPLLLVLVLLQGTLPEIAWATMIITSTFAQWHRFRLLGEIAGQLGEQQLELHCRWAAGFAATATLAIGACILVLALSGRFEMGVVVGIGATLTVLTMVSGIICRDLSRAIERHSAPA